MNRCKSIFGAVLLMWLILGSTSLLAQSDTAPPVMTAAGIYTDLAENYQGQFQLERRGSGVFAKFGTAHIPVQFFARQGAEVLFTIPEGFRPATAITWEVNARHVQADGFPHPTRTEFHVFGVSVDTEGRVRYAEDSGVDGVGYLRYDTELAWPLAGAEPRVCARSTKVQDLIHAALDEIGEAVLSCEQLTWSHLLRIKEFPSQEPIEIIPNDLLGLTNLTELHLISKGHSKLPDEFLAYTPHLKKVSVISPQLVAIPADFLVYTPRLGSLSFGFTLDRPFDFLDIPVDMLVHTPHLTSLHISRSTRAPLKILLGFAPQLTHLSLYGGTGSPPLPADLLSSNPNLTHLSISSGGGTCIASDLLTPVPALTHLELRLWNLQRKECLSETLQWPTPELTHFSLDVQGLGRLRPGFVFNSRQLTHLTLDVSGMTAFPVHLLAQTPNLTHLRLHDSDEQRTGSTPEGLTLPEQLFSSTPHLVNLELEVKYLNNIPVDLLAHVPRLRNLKLHGGKLETLPVDLLASVPELTSLELELETQTSLPSDLLDLVPELTDLTIVTRQVRSLPSEFLDKVPKLTELSLSLVGLESLPDDFLSHPQSLQSFYLGDGGVYSFTRLRSLSENFLSHTPSLTKIVLDAGLIKEFPTSFLSHTPKLESLILPSYYGKGGLYLYPVESLPERFLANAPNLTHLDLAPLGNVTALPSGFLAESPQLQHLNLGAHSVNSLPADFLVGMPRLESVSFLANSIETLPTGFLVDSPYLRSLRMRGDQVERLPDSFLTVTPRLQSLMLSVNQVKVFPDGFLAATPHLEHLEIRADNVGMLPDGFLAQIPQIKKMGLGMPNLVSPPRPADPLWEKLETTSLRTIVSSMEVQAIETDPHFCPENLVLEQGELLEVIRREPDGLGNILLTVFHWWDRDLFFTFYERHWCSFKIDAKYTEPTVKV